MNQFASFNCAYVGWYADTSIKNKIDLIFTCEIPLYAVQHTGVDRKMKLMLNCELQGLNCLADTCNPA
jgi:hypothetical protein